MPKISALIQEFNRAFGRHHEVTPTPRVLTVTERELLGKLLFEEVVEYCTKGLGLEIHCLNMIAFNERNFILKLREGQRYDPVESIDGLADVNVVIHHNALMHGFNLDAATEIVNESNMSKLGEDGEPIINGVTSGYRTAVQQWADEDLDSPSAAHEPGFDSSKPIGKILKGPNYWEPTSRLRQLIGWNQEGNN